ncbi:hypothetical protein CEP52_010908 [Fusarium oligoseptatum]|uniref:Zn(2)-C6 fungal-type domain-containing protein n=1 Tax=Fusarium oligoseptatum TaxID=2604345 RepID=A0A428T5Z4_9HYPO|nr:hypothetical protein CEP52_010908 [Fusarium oligoseptatum]
MAPLSTAQCWTGLSALVLLHLGSPLKVVPQGRSHLQQRGNRSARAQCELQKHRAPSTIPPIHPPLEASRQVSPPISPGPDRKPQKPGLVLLRVEVHSPLADSLLVRSFIRTLAQLAQLNLVARFPAAGLYLIRGVRLSCGYRARQLPKMSPDVADDDAGQSSTQDWQDNDAPSPSASIKSDNEGDEDGPNAPSQPIQKRRRVTRACDECRRKKIKCDGKQPCTHCSVYSYECTYDKPSNRRRNPAPQYIEALESRLQRAESLLHKFMPDVDLADPNLDPAIQQEFRNRENARAQAAKARQTQPPQQPDPNDAHLTSMIDSVGQLDLDEKGSWDFHGISSGAVFLKRMKEHFRGMLGPTGKAPLLPRAERPPGLESPSLSSVGTPYSAVPSYPELPPKDVARKIVLLFSQLRDMPGSNCSRSHFLR